MNTKFKEYLVNEAKEITDNDVETLNKMAIQLENEIKVLKKAVKNKDHKDVKSSYKDLKKIINSVSM